RKNRMSLIFMTLPLVATLIYAVCVFFTYQKVNKSYNLSATFFGDHRYDFYFRTDSTLKTVGHFLLNQVQTFQPYHIKGDTILLDTILPFTGIAQKRYVFGLSADSRDHLLVPINERGQKLHSMSLHFETKNYR